MVRAAFSLPHSYVPNSCLESLYSPDRGDGSEGWMNPCLWVHGQAEHGAVALPLFYLFSLLNLLYLLCFPDLQTRATLISEPPPFPAVPRWFDVPCLRKVVEVERLNFLELFTQKSRILSEPKGGSRGPINSCLFCSSGSAFQGTVIPREMWRGSKTGECCSPWMMVGSAVPKSTHGCVHEVFIRAALPYFMYSPFEKNCSYGKIQLEEMFRPFRVPKLIFLF